MAEPMPEQMAGPSAVAGSDTLLRARDRVLLYTRGMDVDPRFGLEIALDSLRRIGPRAGPVEVMNELHGLLREHGLSPHLENADGRLLDSAPPMNRRPMIAEAMDGLSLPACLRGFMRRLAGLPGTGRGQ